LERDNEEGLKMLLRKLNQNHSHRKKIKPLQDGKNIILEGRGNGVKENTKIYLCFIDKIKEYFENHMKE